MASSDEQDKQLQPEDNNHEDVLEISWNIDEKGNEENKEGDECADVEVKVRESSTDIITPNYKSEFTGFLTEKEYSIETGKHVKNECIPKRTCFNCLGDHNISECQERKDYQAIARNRMTFMGKRTSNVRYHEDGENKFSNFRPGVLSDNLLNALNLKKHQPPEFVYRMRILGYPPGWLKEAEVKRSTVSLFDGTGKAMSHPDDEEGETDVCVTKYQPDKFISFPGFNVVFPEHIKDESGSLNYPQMQPHHKKENFLKFMKRNKADLSKRKKKMEENLSTDLTVQNTPGDMDVELITSDTVIEVKEETVEQKVKKENVELKVKEETVQQKINEETVEQKIKEETVEQKRTEDGELSSDSNDCKGNIESESNSVEPLCLSTSLKRGLEGESSSDSSSAPPSRVKRHHRSSSKGFTLGVCIPDSITPFAELPEPAKWSVNVSDHILFDNLPDSLGTWQKMKGIVKNVQVKLKRYNEDNE